MGHLVILNGGGAGVRDRTSGGNQDGADGNAPCACSYGGPVGYIADAQRRTVPRRAGALLRMTICEGITCVYVMLTSVYVPYTCRSASQISPTVA